MRAQRTSPEGALGREAAFQLPPVSGAQVERGAQHPAGQDLWDEPARSAVQPQPP